NKSTLRTFRFFSTPTLFLIIVIMILPMFFSIYIMFHDVNLLEGGNFVWAGLGNFKKFFQDERALNSLWVTAKYLVGVLSIETIVGLLISFFLDRKFFGKPVVRALIIIPMFMTPVVSGLIWRAFFDTNNGLVNWILSLFKVPMIDWLGSVDTALVSLMITDMWQWTPFMVLLIMASLDCVPTDQIEAAMIDGAREGQIIRHIKFPFILPTTLIAVVMRAIDAVKLFDTVYVMTKGGPGSATEMVNMYSYIIAFQHFRIGYATTISFIFTMIVTVLLTKMIKATKAV
ncbi:MAG: sugar ABC transporter permease, partial [Clostridia bacterium]|nr:sugar ABC transporter permease [Clostridia bacterium]